jgi:uncharacterized Rossmann fold enzyme
MTNAANTTAIITEMNNVILTDVSEIIHCFQLKHNKQGIVLHFHSDVINEYEKHDHCCLLHISHNTEADCLDMPGK